MSVRPARFPALDVLRGLVMVPHDRRSRLRDAIAVENRRARLAELGDRAAERAIASASVRGPGMIGDARMQDAHVVS